MAQACLYEQTRSLLEKAELIEKIEIPQVLVGSWEVLTCELLHGGWGLWGTVTDCRGHAGPPGSHLKG